MKKKTVIALALALALTAGTTGAISFVANAKEATTAEAPSQVTYGTLTEAQLKIVNEHFDAAFYAKNNEDVVEALGTDAAELLKHFVNCGIWEGRQGWPTFNPAAYASAYSDLKDAFGNDIIKYYEHYYTLGVNEERNILTLEDCQKNGIKVYSFFNDNQLVSTTIYQASNLMGTSSYSTVSAAVDSAVDNGAAVVSTDEGTFVVADEKTLLNTEAVEVGTISLSGDKETTIIIYKLPENYDFDYTGDLNNYVPIHDANTIIGYIPMTIMDTNVGNEVIKGEEYDIELFEADGVVIGTEGSTIAGEDGREYVYADSFEGPHTKRMTNYTSIGYESNAVTGIDENGTEETEYVVKAAGQETENGDNVITATVENPDDEFTYSVTYTFHNDKAQNYNAVDENGNLCIDPTHAGETAESNGNGSDNGSENGSSSDGE